MEIIKATDMPNCILEGLFRIEYGESTTLDQLKKDAPHHLWIRFYLEEREGRVNE